MAVISGDHYRGSSSLFDRAFALICSVLGRRQKLQLRLLRLLPSYMWDIRYPWSIIVSFTRCLEMVGSRIGLKGTSLRRSQPSRPSVRAGVATRTTRTQITAFHPRSTVRHKINIGLGPLNESAPRCRSRRDAVIFCWTGSFSLGR